MPRNVTKMHFKLGLDMCTFLNAFYLDQKVACCFFRATSYRKTAQPFKPGLLPRMSIFDEPFLKVFQNEVQIFPRLFCFEKSQQISNRNSGIPDFRNFGRTLKNNCSKSQKAFRKETICGYILLRRVPFEGKF